MRSDLFLDILFYCVIALVVSLSFMIVIKVWDTATDNSVYPKTTILTTVDGCTLYQFERSKTSYNVYFTNCNGSTNYRVPHGKTTRNVEVMGK